MTMSKCVLCENEAAADSSTRLYEFTLSPICQPCKDRCYSHPNDVMTRYPDLHLLGSESQSPAKRDQSNPRLPGAVLGMVEQSRTGAMNAFAGRHSPAVSKRYKDAYDVAQTTVRMGVSIKIAGLLVGAGLFVLFSLMLFAQTEKNGLMLIAGLVLAMIVGGAIYAVGVMISAQGQLLLATLDSAINGSPFLTDEQRAQVMSV